MAPVKMPRRAALLAVTLAGSAWSCAPDATQRPAERTLVIATAADAGTLIPPLISTTQERAVADQIYERLADVGPALNTIGDAGFTPRLAGSWEWAPDSMSIAFRLDSLARWHDGAPVRAADVRYTFMLYSDSSIGSPIAPMLRDIDSVSVSSPLTAVFWFGARSPRQFYQAAGQMQIVPQHLFARIPRAALRTSRLARNPVGSGKFRLARWNPGSSIELVADTARRRERASLNRVIWAISPDFNTAVTRLLTGQASFLESLRPENVAPVASDPRLRVVMLPGLEYGFLLFNLRDTANTAVAHPIFGSRALRRALTMAIDRRGIVANVFDSLALPALGPTVRALPTTDPTALERMQLPYDAAAAERTLDSLGWRRGGDGFRARAGRPLSFSLAVPSSSKTRVQAAVLVQEQMRRIGVRVSVEQMEFTTFAAREAANSFDAVMHAWRVDPTPDGLRQSWTSPASQRGGGTNFGGYANPVFDAQVDSALAERDPAAARDRFTRAYQTIIADAPAVWLYEPRAVAGVARAVRIPRMRVDAWWMNLADWSLDSAARR